MSRLIVAVVVLVLIVGGVLMLLESRASEQPMNRVEKPVALANLQN